MIISASTDYRAAAERRLPPFLFHYIDGGAYAEHTLKRNVSDLSDIALRQRILRNMSDLSLETELFGETLAMPVALAPVGLTGMYARRGEVQAARAADSRGIPFTLSTVSVCPIEEVAPAIQRPMWFQLYVLRDRGFMRNALERAQAAGVTTLVFTVDMPVPGARYRDAHSGMSGPNASLRRIGRPSPIRTGRGTWACSAARMIWATSPPTVATRPGWRITSAGWAATSIPPFPGRTWSGSANSGRARW